MLVCASAGWAADQQPAVVHTLSRGQTLAIVARMYGVPVELVLAANADLVPESIPVGARVTIPPPPDGWACRQAAAGDTLAAFTQRYGVPLEITARLNSLPAITPLAEGQPVLLPRASHLLTQDPAPSQDPTPSPAPAPPVDGQSAQSPSDATWVQVTLADGTRGWAPRSALLLGSPSPLDAGGVVQLALKMKGTPYRWGGQTPNGVDCSGFVQEVFQLSGHTLPRLADEQFRDTVPVDDVRPGDLLFFTTYLPGPSHVGIYLGDGRFVHASSSQGVTEGSLQDSYFAPRYLGAHRIKEWMASGGASETSMRER